MRISAVLLALVTLSLTGCDYNTLQTNDEQIKASWSEILNQYQRRADLIPNLVNYNVTVRSFPSNLTALAFGYKEKPNFAVENEKEISKPPKVDFGAAPAKPEGEAQGAAK